MDVGAGVPDSPRIYANMSSILRDVEDAVPYKRVHKVEKNQLLHR